MMECLNKYAPVFMCVVNKPHTFGNERHTICCCLTSILWINQIMEGKDSPQHLGHKEYNELGKMVSLMLRMCRPICVSDKAVVLNSGFFLPKLLLILKPNVCMR